jgi:hypothetical protein
LAVETALFTYGEEDLTEKAAWYANWKIDKKVPPENITIDGEPLVLTGASK